EPGGECRADGKKDLIFGDGRGAKEHTREREPASLAVPGGEPHGKRSEQKTEGGNFAKHLTPCFEERDRPRGDEKCQPQAGEGPVIKGPAKPVKQVKGTEEIRDDHEASLQQADAEQLEHRRDGKHHGWTDTERRAEISEPIAAVIGVDAKTEERLR